MASTILKKGRADAIFLSSTDLLFSTDSYSLQISYSPQII